MPTFLFTDVESSTRLWEEHPDQMPSALARHDAILRESVDHANGRILKTLGDGIVAVFGNADHAVAAAVKAQTDLDSENWTTEDPLRVRMGIHFGEAEERDGDFFGPTLNRAARIMAAAHGGQVLVSGSLAEQVAGHLPAEVSLLDFGSHRLKDLTNPEHLYQLATVGQNSEFPPPRTLDARPNNLPLQISEFFGREEELAAVKDLLDDPDVRLITLLGPGGTGKTRLGIQAAAEQLDRFDDGVFFVDVSAEREAGSVFEAIVRTVDVPAATDDDPLQSLKARLRDRQMLIVLDNFEQVTVAAPGVAELVLHCPGLQVVITSRESLRVRAERIYQVPPMSLPALDSSTDEIAEAEAVRLFVERARGVRPEFTLDARETRIVAEICHRLDGLPLAIELAAARVNVFSPSDLLDRIEASMTVLGSRSRDLPERQRTLWGTIDWSYELLDDVERRLFEMMSVFSTASLEALEAVAATALDTMDTLDNLASLVDKSLIRGYDIGGTRRFSMLQTVREYSLHRLQQEDEWAATVTHTHAAYYSDYTRSLGDLLDGSQREETLEQLATELGNLRTAWSFWVGAGDLEQLYSLLDGLWALNDAKGWYHAALELARDMLSVLATTETSQDRVEDEMALRASLARAMMAIRGFTPEVEEEFQKALALAENSGESAPQFPVLRVLATYYVMTVDFEKAAATAAKIIELAETEGNQSMMIEGHLLYGSARLDDSSLALAHFDKTIAMFDPATVGESRFRLGASPGVVARNAAALTRWRVGELDRAVATADEAVSLARELDHPFSLAYGLYHNGFLQTQRRRFDLSLQCAEELQRVAAANDYQIWQALGIVLEGVSLAATGQPKVGLAKSETGIELYSGLTTPPVFWTLILALRSFVYFCSDDLDRALSLIDEAIAAGGSVGSIFPEFVIQRGDILRAYADPGPEEPDAAYRQALTDSKAQGLHYLELQARTRLIELAAERGQDPEDVDVLAAIHASIDSGKDEAEMVRAAAVVATQVG